MTPRRILAGLHRHASKMQWVAGVLLALVPVVSFLSQYVLSVQAGTEAALFRHLTVSVVDWIFVPFNMLVIRAIDWRRGTLIYATTIVSIVLNVVVHAFWQYNLIDGGYMITSGGVMLPAGWVHVVFSCLETSLLAAFIFARRSSSVLGAVTVLAIGYFVSAGIAGYVMHDGFIVTDVLMVAAGLFFVIVYPVIVRSRFSVRRMMRSL